MIRKFALATVAIAAALLSTTNATVLNLGSSGAGYVNGAYFAVSATHPTGTGTYNPFLTLQATPREQGYNSSVGNFDTKREPQFNHEIRFSDLEVTVINGTSYFGFAVDVNEPNGGSQMTISLDGLRLYTSSTLQNSTSTDANGLFNGSLGTLRYTLGNNSVLYTDTHMGSGTDDIHIFIPTSVFAGTQANDYVYMYQLWGNTAASQGGFEETALIHGITPVPEMSALFPIVGLMVAVGSTQVLRRRRM
ncbi:MAG: hypothetical protein M3Z22_06800, partial [Verrucomicrobiota bacterium]|nr:hypothetical protein [Verrucomicrobiota bacterium]